MREEASAGSSQIDWLGERNAARLSEENSAGCSQAQKEQASRVGGHDTHCGGAEELPTVLAVQRWPPLDPAGRGDFPRRSS